MPWRRRGCCRSSRSTGPVPSCPPGWSPRPTARWRMPCAGSAGSGWGRTSPRRSWNVRPPRCWPGAPPSHGSRRAGRPGCWPGGTTRGGPPGPGSSRSGPSWPGSAACRGPVARRARAGAASDIATRALDLRDELAGLGLDEPARVAGVVAARAALRTTDGARGTGQAEPSPDVRMLLSQSRPRGGDRLDTRLGWRLARGEVAAAAGDTASARREAARGLADLHEARVRLGAADLRGGSSVHGRELARLGLDLAVRDGRAAEVLAWSERARAQALLLPPVLPPDDPRAASWLAELRSVDAAIGARRDEGQPVGDLGVRQEQLRRRLREQSWTVSGTPAAQERVGLGRLREELGRDTALVAWLPVGRRLSALVVTGDVGGRPRRRPVGARRRRPAPPAGRPRRRGRSHAARPAGGGRRGVDVAGRSRPRRPAARTGPRPPRRPVRSSSCRPGCSWRCRGRCCRRRGNGPCRWLRRRPGGCGPGRGCCAAPVPGPLPSSSPDPDWRTARPRPASLAARFDGPHRADRRRRDRRRRAGRAPGRRRRPPRHPRAPRRRQRPVQRARARRRAAHGLRRAVAHPRAAPRRPLRVRRRPARRPPGRRVTRDRHRLPRLGRVHRRRERHEGVGCRCPGRHGGVPRGPGRRCHVPRRPSPAAADGTGFVCFGAG